MRATARTGVCWLTLVAGGLMVIGGCGRSTTSTVTGPTQSRCPLTLSAQPTAMEASGGRGVITVATNRECAWEIATATEWIRLESPVSGQGDAAVAFAIASNPTAIGRQGAVTANEQRLELSQTGVPCGITLRERSAVFASEGGRRLAPVEAPTGCRWTAVSSDAWIRVRSGAAGDGNGAVEVEVDPQLAPQPRRGAIVIADQSYRVEQAGAPPEPGPSPTPPSPTPPAPSPPPPAPPAPTPPTPNPPPPTTPDPPPAPPAPNPPAPGPAPPAPPSCSFEVTPAELAVDEKGGKESITVTTGPTCSWRVEEQVDWVRIDGRDERRGPDRVRLNIRKNDSRTPRVGTALVAGRVITVRQDGRGRDDDDDEDEDARARGRRGTRQNREPGA